MSDSKDNAAEGGEGLTCEWCGRAIDRSRCRWRRFCNDRCRNRFNAAAGRIGRRILKEQREAGAIKTVS